MEVMKEGPCLNRDQQLALIAPMTEEEIVRALSGIKDLKAPGCGGYNIFFFKVVWPVIGKDITAAMIEFFTTKKMHLAINCTIITLIPKVSNASGVIEFRPISCCTILYRLISRVITGRIQNTMAFLINNNQSTFVPGRVINDNIIMSHELVKCYGRKGVSPRCMLKVDMRKAYDFVE